MIVHTLKPSSRITPTQFAKLVVAERGVQTCYYWHEFYPEELGKMTERETFLVDEAIEKQAERVRKFIGYDDI